MDQQLEWRPYSIEIEQELLGAMLVWTEAPRIASDILSASDFYEPVHRDLFDIMSKLATAGKKLTPTLVASFVPANFEVIKDVSIKDYIGRLAAASCTLTSTIDYANTIRELADRRKIASVGHEMTFPRERDTIELADWGIQQLDEIVSARSTTATPTVGMEAAMARAIDAAATAYQNEGRIPGMAYGMRDLDRKTLGGQRGELTVIAGRPSMGKTAVATCIARNLAEGGYSGRVQSLEMGDVSLSQRMIADWIYPKVSLTYWQLRAGTFHESIFPRITEAAEALGKLPLKIDQQTGLTVSQIAARARQQKNREGLDFLIVDHLGLVKPSQRYAGNKVNETGEITSGLKSLAKELGIHVILLCQLNRGLEAREDKRPGLADLRHSGDIEQDADVVIMLYREAYYLLRAEPRPGTDEHGLWQEKMTRSINRLDAIIEKQRSGPIATVSLFCDIGANAVRDLQQ